MGTTVWQRKAATAAPAPVFPDEAFRNYWTTGKTERTSYDLRRVQPDEPVPGEAVLIFTAGAFRTDTQEPLDDAGTTAYERLRAVPVLTMSQERRLAAAAATSPALTAVFMPLDTKLFPHALQVRLSFGKSGLGGRQLTLRSRQYHLTSSPPEEEENAFDRAWLEDELWTRLRLSPESLPTGEVDVVPGLLFSRLNRRVLQPEPATAARRDTTFGAQHVGVYTLDYPGLKRRVALFFEKNAPYQLVGWEETTAENGQPLTTRATRRP
jgi:hypothetical protein